MGAQSRPTRAHMHGRSRSTPTRVPELTPRAAPLRAHRPASAFLLPVTRRGRGGARPREGAVARLRSLVTCLRRRRREPSGAMAVPGGGGPGMGWEGWRRVGGGMAASSPAPPARPLRQRADPVPCAAPFPLATRGDRYRGLAPPEGPNSRRTLWRRLPEQGFSARAPASRA